MLSYLMNNLIWDYSILIFVDASEFVSMKLIDSFEYSCCVRLRVVDRIEGIHNDWLVVSTLRFLFDVAFVSICFFTHNLKMHLI